ncbi:MAG: chemotaxis response regulator protein-glutamate methylesterase [Anaerolineae bacterium]|nr:chemotaxis response regulator protein-glutamate methylesterase [Anaerolineae bacterium]
MCHTLTKYLDAEPDITVVGRANDGIEALEKIAELKPDVITLDVEMPRMGGLETLQRIMVENPTPVIMLSALTQRGARITVQALMFGAVDCVPKPSQSFNIRSTIKELIPKIRAAGGMRSSRLIKTVEPAPTPSSTERVGPQPFHTDDPLIIVGSSTGGPRALRQLLADLPGDLPAALIIVQHMPLGFTASLAQRLNQTSALTVQEAAHGDRIARGLVLVAPSGYHLKFRGRRQVELDQGPRRNGVRPAVDITMESAAQYHGASVIGVVLTGMGADGTVGAHYIKSTGGIIVAEHESTCAVYGMPRSVIEADLADHIVPMPKVAATLVELVNKAQERVS